VYAAKTDIEIHYYLLLIPLLILEKKEPPLGFVVRFKKDAALRNGVWTFGLAFSAGNCPPNHTNLQLCTFLAGYPPHCYEFGLEQSYRFAPCHFLFNIPSFRSFLGYGFVSY
jgi:hypothetical protein